MAQAAELARGAGLSLHLDGARAFNAAVAHGLSLAEVCEPYDTVSLCFSKGLGAPVGSVLVGDEAAITRAHRARKMLGGGMRQVGILAAACQYAMEHHVARLAEDHANAARLAQGLAQIEELAVEEVATNMVFVAVPPGRCAPLRQALADEGVLAAVAPRTRLVLHLDVTVAGVDRAVQAFKAYFAGL